NGAVISVIELRRVAAEGSFGEADETQQEAGLFVEVKAERRLPLTTAKDEPGLVAIDRFAGERSKFGVERRQIGGEVEAGIDPRSIHFSSGHHVRALRKAEPSLRSVESSDAVAIFHMHGRETLVGRLSINIDGGWLGATFAGRNEIAMLDAAGDLVK